MQPRASNTKSTSRTFHRSPVFWTTGRPSPAALLRILLIRAGVESNPGPQIWLCSVCSQRIRGNSTSVLCNGCQNWSHLKRCSGLSHHRDWSPMHISPCCTPPSTPSGSTLSLNTLTDKPPSTLNILQHNCNGLSRKLTEIINYMEKHKILIAAIQETRLTANSKLKNWENYTIHRQDRGRGSGGGLAFIIHDSVLYQKIDPPANPQLDNHLEIQCIRVTSGVTNITLINIYIPPASSCETGYQASINHLLQSDDTILMGDFNAHNDLWHSEVVADQRGEIIADEIDNSEFGVLNEPAPTRVVSSTNSSPDITIASASLLPSTTWKVEMALSSDHLPIIISLNRKIDKCKTENRTYINFTKARWDQFTEFTEAELANTEAPNNIHNGEKILREILMKARTKFIPAGRIPLIRPCFPRAAATLADVRDRKRKDNPADPDIPDLNRRITRMVDDHRKNKWEQHLKTASFSQGPKNLWKTIKGLTNPPRPKPNNTISFANNPATCPSKCAKQFNIQFTEHPQHNSSELRRILRRARTHTVQPTTERLTVTTEMTEAAIKRAKTSKAIGPDGISTIMLKHLGENGIKYLTILYNLSLDTLQLPQIWRVGRIIPILKPGKSADDGKSYRPISLLSPIIKVLEHIVHNTITPHLQLADHQHGFRKGRSTTTALHQLHDQISRGLNERRPCSRTIVVALDLSKAFDTVSHTHLLNNIHESATPPGIKRWLTNYIRGRYTYVEFRNTKSTYRKMKQGVPQGGVLSPTLFNLIMSHLPTPPPDIKLLSYADDCSILMTGSRI